MKFEQNDFSGGMNMLSSDMAIAENGYRWLINARQRLGYIDANKKNIEIDDAPPGKKQGIVAVGDTLIVFVNGLAYYQIDGTVGWVQIPGFSMDTVADRYWSQPVPASTFDFVRKTDGVSANNPIVIDPDFAINGTPACILVQDGVTQPHIILFDSVNQTFIARPTKTYDEWTATDHEYVPIGRQMMFKNNITFIVAQDGKSVYRSVTGRPLDFVVSVDIDGNKLTAELNGGAARTSFAFDFDEITCMVDTNADSIFILATDRNIRLVAIDNTFTIFGEPLFRQVAIIEAGVVNQESVVEVLGDYAFVDFENVKLFNAVEQLRNEGRNSIFSLNLSSILNGIKQKEPCCFSFNNYALFYLKTNFGNLIAVYGTLHEKWVSLDLTVADRIKQFAAVETITETKLYAITHHDELFQMYASDERELAQLMTRSFTPFAEIEHKAQNIKPLFRGGSQTGDLIAIEYVDDQQSDRVLSEFIDQSAGINYPVQPPVIPNNAPSMKHDTLTFKDGLMGKKIAYILQWNTDARLHGFVLNTSEILRDTSLGQQAKVLQDTYGG